MITLRKNSDLNFLKAFWSLRESLLDRYSVKDLRSDLFAGIIVGIVAIPLAMALAIASGVGPQYGLYTAIFAGALAALFGGSRFQISGPTAAFVVLLVPVVTNHGLAGLLLSGLIAGILLILFGFFKLGNLIRLVPHPVTTGFTSGIAVVIAVIQIKDFFGLQYLATPENFIERVYLLVANISDARPGDLILGISCLSILLFMSKFFKKTPGPIVAILAVSIFSLAFQKYFPDLEFSTIESKFAGGIPKAFPKFSFDFLFHGSFIDSWTMIVEVFPSAIAIAFLGAIESLLSGTVAEGMTRKPMDPNRELIGIGIGIANIL